MFALTYLNEIPRGADPIPVSAVGAGYGGAWTGQD